MQTISCKQTKSVKSITAMLDKLPDKKSPYWQEWELDILRKYYRKKGNDAVAKAIGRTEKAVRMKARELKI